MSTPIDTTPLRRSILIAAGALGVAGDVLIRGHLPDGHWALWILMCCAGLPLVAFRHDITLPRSTIPWLAAAALTSLLLTWRADHLLVPLILLGTIGCLSMAAWSARGGTPFFSPIFEWIRQPAFAALHAALGAAGYFFHSAQPPRLAGALNARSLIPRLVLGAILATPLLLLFGTLFAAADPVFRRGVEAVISFDLSNAWIHAASVLAGTWVVAGSARRCLLPNEARDPGLNAPPPPSRAPWVEVTTVLTLVALLFLAFVAVQVRYLFGDHELVRATAGLTYAEYARQGFFELLAVAAVLLPVLLLADWLMIQSADRRAFRGLVTLLLGLLGVVLMSAYRRMNLYTDAYGWTNTRLHAVAALVWVTCLAVLVLATVARGERPRFAGPAFVCGLAILFGLQALNPDAFVARHQLARAAAGQELDLDHLARLGPDATPTLVAALPGLTETQRTTLTKAMHRRLSATGTWNLGRYAAQQALATLAEPAR